MCVEFSLGLGRSHLDHVGLCADRRVSDQSAIPGAIMWTVLEKSTSMLACQQYSVKDEHLLLNALLLEAIVHLACPPTLSAAYEIEQFGCARDVL